MFKLTKSSGENIVEMMTDEEIPIIAIRNTRNRTSVFLRNNGGMGDAYLSARVRAHTWTGPAEMLQLQVGTLRLQLSNLDVVSLCVRACARAYVGRQVGR